MAKSTRGRKQDRARVAGGQKHEVRYAAKKAGKSKAAVKREPVRDFDFYMAQGDNLRERERASAALDAYGKAADMDPDRAEPIAGRGLALYDMSQLAAAEAAFLEALKKNARYGVAIMGLAETYKAMGKKDKAIKFYENRSTGARKIESIIVGGGSASMPGYLEYMAGEISIPVIVADPWTGLNTPKHVHKVSKYDAPMYTTAIGLARMEGQL